MAVETPPRTIRMVADDGSLSGPERPLPALSESEAEASLIEYLDALHVRIDPATQIREEVATLKARLELRQAQRQPRRGGK